MLDSLNTESAGGEMLPAPTEPKPARADIHTIAIVGSHPATVATAPFGDPGALIYACSPHNVEKRTLPRWDHWFEVHLPVQHETRSYAYLRGLEEQARQKEARGEKPVVWIRDPQALPHFPGGRAYPEAEMKRRFCPYLFSSSIAFMLAKAIVDAEAMGVRQIGMWGILQASETEYAYQRPGTQYFLWEATRRGIKVLAAAESKLFELPPEIF